MDKVSIIIPIYNCEEYLKECLESVLKQTYSPNLIEVIMINDGTKDNSDKICEEYNDKYGWIFIDRKENKGLAYTRNEGIKCSSGDFIMFLDSDDLLYENAVISLINNQHKYNSDIVISKLNSFNSGGQYGYYSDKYLKKEKAFSFKENKKIINCMSVCGKIYKKDLLKKIKFIDGVVHEDNYFTICSFYNSNKLSILPEYTYLRRIREGNNKSIMQNLTLKTYNDLIINFKQAIYDIEKIDFKTKNLMLRKLINYIVNNLTLDEEQIALKNFRDFVDMSFKNDVFLKKLVVLKYSIYFRVAKLYKKVYNIIRIAR